MKEQKRGKGSVQAKTRRRARRLVAQLLLFAVLLGGYGAAGPWAQVWASEIEEQNAPTVDPEELGSPGVYLGPKGGAKSGAGELFSGSEEQAGAVGTGTNGNQAGGAASAGGEAGIGSGEIPADAGEAVSAGAVAFTTGMVVRAGGFDWYVAEGKDPARVRLFAARTVASMPYAASANLWATSQVSRYLNNVFVQHFSGDERQILKETRVDTYMEGRDNPTESGRFQIVIPSKEELSELLSTLGPEAMKSEAGYWVRTRPADSNSLGILARIERGELKYETMHVSTKEARWCDAAVRPMITMNLGAARLTGQGTAAEPFQIHSIDESRLGEGEARYKIRVRTGANLFGARSTDQVNPEDFTLELTLTGDAGESAPIRINAFEGGASPAAFTTQEYLVTGGAVGAVRSLTYRAAGQALTADWYISSIDVVAMEENGAEGATAHFRLGRWVLNPERITAAAGTAYQVKVKTGDRALAGTDADIYLRLIGEDGTMTDERELSGPMRDSGAWNAFERDTTQEAPVTFDCHVGTLDEIQLRSSMSGAGPDWYPDWIQVTDPTGTHTVTFQIKEWIADTDTHIYTVRPAKSNQYRITVQTGNVFQAGTDANIYVSLTGDGGTTAERELTRLYSGNAFERNTTHSVVVNFDRNIGEIRSLQLRSDQTGIGPDWYVDQILVEPIVNGETMPGTEFVLDQWIADTQTKTFSADPEEGSQYRVTVKTADKDSGGSSAVGTDGDVQVCIIGEKGTTEPVSLGKLMTGNPFEAGNTDAATAVFNKNVGTITGVKVRIADAEKTAFSDWYPEWIQVEPVWNGQTQPGGETFEMGQWFTNSEWKTFGGNTKKEYRVTLTTSGDTWSGTNSDVYLRMVGEKGTTEDVELSMLIKGDAFEAGSTDAADIKLYSDVGKIKQIQLKCHQGNADPNPSWKLTSVDITPLEKGQPKTAETIRVVVNTWLDADEKWRTFDVLPAGAPTWEIDLTTNDVAGAGTDATIFLRIVGSRGTSEKIDLTNDWPYIVKKSGGGWTSLSDDWNSWAYRGSYQMERDTITRVYVQGKTDIGEPQYAVLSMHDGTSAMVGPEWNLRKIALRGYVGAEKTPRYTMEADAGSRGVWIRWPYHQVNGANFAETFRLAPRTEESAVYEVAFQTGTDFGAGGSGSMRFHYRIHGTGGTTEWRQADTSTAVSGNFSNGSRAVYYEAFDKNVGEIKGIEISLDPNYGLSMDKWQLQSIAVKPCSGGSYQSGGKEFDAGGTWLDCDSGTRSWTNPRSI